MARDRIGARHKQGPNPIQHFHADVAMLTRPAFNPAVGGRSGGLLKVGEHLEASRDV